MAILKWTSISKRKKVPTNLRNMLKDRAFLRPVFLLFPKTKLLYGRIINYANSWNLSTMAF